MAQTDPIKRYRNNLRDEVDSASLYRAMADAEANPQLKQVYSRLAQVEEAHAEFWKKRLAGLGAAERGHGPGWRSRTLAWLARRFGPQTVLPIINSMERTGSATYDTQPEAVLAGLPAAERSHAAHHAGDGRTAAGRCRRRHAGAYRGAASHGRRAILCVRQSSAPMTGWSPT